MPDHTAGRRHSQDLNPGLRCRGPHPFHHATLSSRNSCEWRVTCRWLGLSDGAEAGEANVYLAVSFTAAELTLQRSPHSSVGGRHENPTWDTVTPQAIYRIFIPMCFLMSPLSGRSFEFHFVIVRSSSEEISRINNQLMCPES